VTKKKADDGQSILGCNWWTGEIDRITLSSSGARSSTTYIPNIQHPTSVRYAPPAFWQGSTPAVVVTQGDGVFSFQSSDQLYLVPLDS